MDENVNVPVESLTVIGAGSFSPEIKLLDFFISLFDTMVLSSVIFLHEIQYSYLKS